MYTLPGLKPLLHSKLHEVIGWSWVWERDAVALRHLASRCTASTPSATLSIVGPCQELLTLSLSPSHAPLPMATALFDWDLAAAAASAQGAMRAVQSEQVEKAGPAAQAAVRACCSC